MSHTAFAWYLSILPLRADNNDTCCHQFHGILWKKKHLPGINVFFFYQAEKGNNTTLPTLFNPAVKLLSSSRVSTSKLKRHLWYDILNLQVQLRSKYLYDPTPCWFIHVNSKTISADMMPSLLRPSNWVRKNPLIEKKKLAIEPHMKDPSPWDGQTHNGCHIYIEHHSFQWYINICNNSIDSDGDSDDNAHDIEKDNRTKKHQ